jgi:hypothetical protein
LVELAREAAKHGQARGGILLIVFAIVIHPRNESMANYTMRRKECPSLEVERDSRLSSRGFIENPISMRAKASMRRRKALTNTPEIN